MGIRRALHPEQQHEEVADRAEDDLVSLHHRAEVLGIEGHICTLAAAEQVVQVCVVVRGFTLQDWHLFCKRSQAVKLWQVLTTGQLTLPNNGQILEEVFNKGIFYMLFEYLE